MWAIPFSPSLAPILRSVFERAGFELDVYFGPNRDDDLAQVYVARKPASAMTENCSRQCLSVAAMNKGAAPATSSALR